MDTQTQIATTKKDNSWITKLLIGLGLAGGAWFLFSSFTSKSDAELPDINDVTDDPSFENQDELLDQRFYGILVSGTEWPAKLVKRAVTNKTTFQHELWAEGIALYAEKGPETNQQVIKQLEVRIKYFEIIIKKTVAWYELVEQQATEKSISVAAALRNAARYSAINELVKPWEANVTRLSGSAAGNGTSGIGRVITRQSPVNRVSY